MLQARVVEQEINAYPQYRKLVEGLLRDIERQDQATIRRVIGLLHEARMRIAQDLVTAEGWDLYHLRNLREMVARALREFESRYYAELAAQQGEAYRRGSAMITEPLRRMGYRLIPTDLSPYELMIIQGYSADLIKGLVGNALTRINTALTLGVLAEKSVLQVMQEITDILGVERLEAVGGFAYRAERIARTELGRVRNMATFARLREVAEAIPGLMKEWVSVLLIGRTRGSPGTKGPYNHWGAHGQRVLVNEPFIISGEELMYPIDPAGSPGNTIFCMCSLQAYHPSWEISIRGEELPGGYAGILRR